MDEIEKLRRERDSLDKRIKKIQAERSVPGWLVFLQSRIGGERIGEHLRTDGDAGVGILVSSMTIMASIETSPRGIEILEALIALIRARIDGQEV